MPGREIVEAHDLLPEAKQRLEQMRADEAGAAGHEPAPRPRRAAPHKPPCTRRRRAALTGASSRWRLVASEPPHLDAARAQRGLSAWHLTSTYEPVRLELFDEIADRALPRTRDARRPRPSHGRAAASSQASSATPYSCTASAGSATGSWTWTSTPYDASSRMTSITRELRRSGQFSLNVRPSTFTCAALDGESGLDHLLDGLFGDVLAHPVVDPASGENHLRVIAELVRLVRQIVGIDADAVSADEPRPERQEIPLGSGSLQHLDRVDADLVEDQRKLVHQRDVEVALRVLDHLGRFGDLDAARAMHAGGDDASVNRCNPLERFRPCRPTRPW